MSVSYIFSEFEGASNLARALGYPFSTVQNWKDRDSIPAKHQAKVLQVAIELKKNIKPEHFFDLSHKPSRTLKSQSN